MSAGQERVSRRGRKDDDAALEVLGQQVWFVDQIEPFGVVREPIAPGDRVIGFVVEDAKSPRDQKILRRVQANRVRKYGDRYFIVPSWFARADQAARQLEKQLARGLSADRNRAYWEGLAGHLGDELLDSVLRSYSPPTYAVVGQLAQAADALAQDLMRASVQFRRVQRALVANQEVMAPAEYAEFVDETRKWARTIRFLLMAVEFFARTVPRAQIDLRNPDAPLPAEPRYIPHDDLLDIHTPGGEGRARDRPPAPAVEVGQEPTFDEVFEEGEAWHEEAEPGAGFGEFGKAVEEFAPVAPLKDYDEDFEPVEASPAVADLEPVTGDGAGPDFEPVEETQEFAPAAAQAGVLPQQGPVEPVPGPETFELIEDEAPPGPATQDLPEEDDEMAFTPLRSESSRKGAWVTPPPPPAPRPATVRQTERAEKLRGKPDLEAIIAASLGRTPAKTTRSKASQGEIEESLEAPSPTGGTMGLSRDLASLLEKSKKRK